ncbi:MAG: serine/threonine protein phosphatase [Nitrospirae bacterium]|nr:serine/threonine protein phosphatase [Nitrospirota bacterium]
MKNRVFSSCIKNVFAAGDLHGDYKSFKNILNIYLDHAKDSLLLFLGDYADRGPSGVEIITELNKLLRSRDDIVALKGNHESYTDGRPYFYPCDLVHEAKIKYSSWESFYKEIMHDFLSRLYIAAIVNNILFVHAGISSKIKTLDDLEDRLNEKDILWSDPSPASGERPNTRGAGITFGEDITTKALSSLGLQMIMRSHEPWKAANGPYAEHGGKVITINSCMSYANPLKPFLLKIATNTLEYKPFYL